MRFLFICASALSLTVNTASADEVQPELLALLQACEQSAVTASRDPLVEINIEVRELLAGLWRVEGDVIVDGQPMALDVRGSSYSVGCRFRLNHSELMEQPPHPGPTVEAWLQSADRPNLETYFDPQLDARVYFVCEGYVTYQTAVYLHTISDADRRRASDRGVALTDEAVAIGFQAQPLAASDCAGLNERIDDLDLRGT